MNVINEVLPNDPARIQAMQETGPEGPIVMVNLLKFRQWAAYPDGRDAHLSGRAAYERYSTEVLKLVAQHGGRPLFAGDVTFLALGQVEELWDEIALVEYPNRKALWDMSTSPDWQAIAIHRQAGLAGQLNIETTWAQGLTAFSQAGAEG